MSERYVEIGSYEHKLLEPVHEYYKQREKTMRSALEWACKRIDMYSAESHSDLCGRQRMNNKCDKCPIKQALEGK